MTLAVVALSPGDAAAILPVVHAAFAAQPVGTDPPLAALRETTARLGARIGIGGGFRIRVDGHWRAVVRWAVEDADALHFGRLGVRPAARRGKARVTLGVRLVLGDHRRLFASCGYVETVRTAHPGYGQSTSATIEKHIQGGLSGVL